MIELWGSQNNASTNAVSSHMDGVGDRISGMRIYLDGDVMVGYMLPSIDRGLGDRARTYMRAGTVYERQ